MEATLYLQFKKSAERFSDLMCCSDDDGHLNYAQAGKVVDGISYRLHVKGVKAGDVVALYTGKSKDSLLVFLALSKLGATCLTLDLAFPEDMIKYVLSDAKVSHVIGSKSFPVATEIKMLTLCELTKSAEGESPTMIEGHTAWLVYSSGTTGRPKGINLSGSAMLHSIFSRQKFSAYASHDKVACNIYFYWEAFRPLFFGAHVLIVSDKLLFGLNRYVDFLFENKITETLWTPSFAEMLLSQATDASLSKLNALTRVWFNGEVVSDKLATDVFRCLPSVNCFNLYSISETFDVSAQLIERNKSDESVCASIGKPLAGVTAWILDEHGKQCETGETGELYLHSKSLADGYLNAPEAQAKAFVHINSAYTLACCYRTKDLAYQSESGEIFILGRNDHVVKLRGYNVSLLSIEDALKKSLAIRQCVVKLDGSQAINQVLVAALEPENYDEFIKIYRIDLDLGFSKPLQTQLATVLPSYSIPAKFIVKRSLSLDPYSTKLDVKKIFNKYSDDKLLAIWQDIFSMQENELNGDSHFFDLGANSLQAIELMHRVQKIFNFSFSIEQLEQHSTLASQRSFLNEPNNQNVKGKINYLNDLTFDFSLTPKATTINNLSQAEHVFITGVTGFLGAHWLEKCLKTTTAEYYCLIRADNETNAMARLRQTFEHYQLDISLLNERVHVLVGCLTKPYLGIKQSAWDVLSLDMDIILHAASHVNLLYPYKRLKASIVDGGRCMLTLAVTKKIKPIVIISSDAVYPNLMDVKRNEFLDEDTFEKLRYGYAQAKWVQEALIKKMTAVYSLPFLVVRLGNLAPSLNTGIINKDDVNHLFCKIIHSEKRVPMSLAIEFTPVDKVVSYLVMKDINASILPLSNSTVIHQTQLTSLMPEWSLKAIPENEWHQLLEEKMPELLALTQTQNESLLGKNNEYVRAMSLSEAEKKKILNQLANVTISTSAERQL